MSGKTSQPDLHDRYLLEFFGTVSDAASEAKALMKQHLSFISVEPVFRRRLSIFVRMPVLVLPWEMFLLSSGYRREEVCWL